MDRNISSVEFDSSSLVGKSTFLSGIDAVGTLTQMSNIVATKLTSPP
jgi:hypothetical protein